jgi:hypothetical protein
VLGLTDQILAKSDQELALFPRSHEVRLALVQLAEPTLREIDGRQSGGPRALRSLVRSLLSEWRIHCRLGEEELAQQAIEEASRLVQRTGTAEDPDDEARRLQAEVALADAEWNVNEDRLEPARAACERVRRILSASSVRAASSLTLLAARCDRIDAQSATLAGDPATARMLLERAEGALSVLPGAPEADQERLRLHLARGQIALEAGDRTRSRVDLDRAVELGDLLEKSQPLNTEARLLRDLALILRAQWMCEDPAVDLDHRALLPAVSDLNSALTDLGKMYRQDVEVVDFGRILIRGFNQRVRLLILNHQFDDTEGDLEQLAKIRARFAQNRQGLLSTRERVPGRDLRACDWLERARTHANMAALEEGRYNAREARGEWKSALEVYEGYRKLVPHSPVDSEIETHIRSRLQEPAAARPGAVEEVQDQGQGSMSIGLTTNGVVGGRLPVESIGTIMIACEAPGGSEYQVVAVDGGVVKTIRA